MGNKMHGGSEMSSRKKRYRNFWHFTKSYRQLKAKQAFEEAKKVGAANPTPLTYKGAFVGVKFDGQQKGAKLMGDQPQDQMFQLSS